MDNLQEQLEQKIEQVTAMKCYLIAVEADDYPIANAIAEKFNLNI